MTSKLKTDVLETVSGSGTIALTNQLSGMTSDSMPAGSVVQVVQNYAASSSAINTTSTSYAASGIQATITPKFANSLILISFSSSMAHASSGYMRVNMYLGGSAMAGSGMYQIGYSDANVGQYAPLCFNGQHPATSTSALLFEPYFMSGTGAVVRIVHSSASYALTLTEIKQ